MMCLVMIATWFVQHFVLKKNRFKIFVVINGSHKVESHMFTVEDEADI